jgi:hypothetical protein
LLSPPQKSQRPRLCLGSLFFDRLLLGGRRNLLGGLDFFRSGSLFDDRSKTVEAVPETVAEPVEESKAAEEVAKPATEESKTEVFFDRLLLGGRRNLLGGLDFFRSGSLFDDRLSGDVRNNVPETVAEPVEESKAAEEVAKPATEESKTEVVPDLDSLRFFCGGLSNLFHGLGFFDRLCDSFRNGLGRG